MLSKIFTIILIAGISIMVVSLYTQPSIDMAKYELNKSLSIPMIPGGTAAPLAAIPSKTFADYLPYIGGVSAAVGLAEKLVKLFKWLFYRKK